MRHVKLSQVGNVDTFRDRVAAHAKEMNGWDDHMKRVHAGEAQAYPAPDEHPAITACIAQDHAGRWVPQFDFVDDGPTPEQVLEAKKAKHHQAVLNAEVAAKNAVVPPRKERLREVRRADLRRAYTDALMRDPKSPKPAALQSIERDDDRVQAIYRHAAEQIAEIDDLTADAVDGWTHKPFPGE